MSEAAASNGPSSSPMQLSGSIDNSESAWNDDDTDGGLSAFDQSLEKLSHGLKTVCSFDSFLGLDLLMDHAEDITAVNAHASKASSGWKSENLKVQGGINKKTSAGRVASGCLDSFDQDALGEVFQDIFDR